MTFGGSAASPGVPEQIYLFTTNVATHEAEIEKGYEPGVVGSPTEWTAQKGTPAGAWFVIYVKAPLGKVCWLGRTLSPAWKPPEGDPYSYLWVELVQLSNSVPRAELPPLPVRRASQRIESTLWGAIKARVVADNPEVVTILEDWCRNPPEEVLDEPIHLRWRGPSPWPFGLEVDLQSALRDHFLQREEVRRPNQADGLGFSSEWEVQLGSAGRADLLFIDLSPGRAGQKRLVLVEVKLLAQAGDVMQAVRYRDWLREHYPQWEVFPYLAALAFTQGTVDAAAEVQVHLCRVRWPRREEGGAMPGLLMIEDLDATGRAAPESVAPLEADLLPITPTVLLEVDPDEVVAPVIGQDPSLSKRRARHRPDQAPYRAIRPVPFESGDGEGFVRRVVGEIVGCGLACRQCYSSFGLAGADTATWMTPAEAADRIMDVGEIRETESVILSHGEPLLYPDHVTELAEVLLRGAPDLYFRIETNGLHARQEVVTHLNAVGKRHLATEPPASSPDNPDWWRSRLVLDWSLKAWDPEIWCLVAGGTPDQSGAVRNNLEWAAKNADALFINCRLASECLDPLTLQDVGKWAELQRQDWSELFVYEEGATVFPKERAIDRVMGDRRVAAAREAGLLTGDHPWTETVVRSYSLDPLWSGSPTET